MSYFVNGTLVEEDTSFEDAFWKKAIGIIVGVAVLVAIVIGGYIWV